MLLAIFAVRSCSTRMVRLVTQTPSVEVLFSPRSPVPSRYPDGRQPGVLALVSRFDGKAERRLVAENMLKIERQAV